MKRCYRLWTTIQCLPLGLAVALVVSAGGCQPGAKPAANGKAGEVQAKEKKRRQRLRTLPLPLCK